MPSKARARGRGTTWFIRTGRQQLRAAALPPRRADGKNFKGPLLVARRDRKRAPSPSGISPITCIAPGLPVPTPIAARYRRRGLFYRADLITQRIENSEPLAARLLKGPLSLTQWIAVGRCIRRFHDAGVCHADLNAHNILLTPRAGLPHRLRSRHAAQARLVGGHDAGAAVSLAREGDAARPRRKVSPTRTGTRCWPAIANPRGCRRPPSPEAPRALRLHLSSPI